VFLPGAFGRVAGGQEIFAGLIKLALPEQGMTERVTGDWVIRIYLHDVAEQILGLCIVAFGHQDQTEVQSHPWFCSTRGQRAAIKRLFADPIAAAMEAAADEGYKSDQSDGRDESANRNRQFEDASGNKNQKSDAGEIKPVLGHSRVQRDQIGNREKREQKPSGAEGPDGLGPPGAQRAVTKCSCEEEAA
jgi:hypothetical protein